MTKAKPVLQTVADGEVKSRPVQIGLVYAGRTEVLQGLKEGEDRHRARRTVPARWRRRIACQGEGRPEMNISAWSIRNPIFSIVLSWC